MKNKKKKQRQAAILADCASSDRIMAVLGTNHTSPIGFNKPVEGIYALYTYHSGVFVLHDGMDRPLSYYPIPIREALAVAVESKDWEVDDTIQ